MNRRNAVLLFALLTPAAAFAQADRQSARPAVGIAAVKPLYDEVRGFLIKSAEMIAETDLAFKPVATVRSYGEILGHLANENYDFCAAAVGAKSPRTIDFEKITSKSEMVRALKGAFAYCDAAYGISERDAMGETTLFGTKGSKLWVLNYNVAHDNEHYGNLVTYLRIKGLVPPSSTGN
ncbi:MAG: DinB family protein [Gemmatimonadales bacterium]|nr:DinB family protein [Gemmatimonadales bacterium]